MSFLPRLSFRRQSPHDGHPLPRPAASRSGPMIHTDGASAIDPRNAPTTSSSDPPPFFPPLTTPAPPPLRGPAVAADYDAAHLCFGGGVAIFHLATARVVVCYHPRARVWFLPKGRKDAGEEAEAGAVREGYEEV